MIPLMMILPLLFAHQANLTYPTDCTSFNCLMQWGNTITDGYAGIIINAVFFAILIGGLLMSGVDVESAALIASFVSVFIALALIAIGILTPYFIFVWIAAMVVFFLLGNTKGVSNPYG